MWGFTYIVLDVKRLILLQVKKKNIGEEIVRIRSSGFMVSSSDI